MFLCAFYFLILIKIVRFYQAASMGRCTIWIRSAALNDVYSTHCSSTSIFPSLFIIIFSTICSREGDDLCVPCRHMAFVSFSHWCRCSFLRHHFWLYKYIPIFHLSHIHTHNAWYLLRIVYFVFSWCAVWFRCRTHSISQSVCLNINLQNINFTKKQKDWKSADNQTRDSMHYAVRASRCHVFFFF